MLARETGRVWAAMERLRELEPDARISVSLSPSIRDGVGHEHAAINVHRRSAEGPPLCEVAAAVGLLPPGSKWGEELALPESGACARSLGGYNTPAMVTVFWPAAAPAGGAE